VVAGASAGRGRSGQTLPCLRHEDAGPLWEPGVSLIPDQVHLPRGTGSICRLQAIFTPA